MFIRGEEYSFLGCSSGGLKERKCYLWRGPEEEVETLLKECGQFDKLKTVSKRMARVGQLFSGVFPSGVLLEEV